MSDNRPYLGKDGGRYRTYNEKRIADTRYEQNAELIRLQKETAERLKNGGKTDSEMFAESFTELLLICIVGIFDFICNIFKKNKGNNVDKIGKNEEVIDEELLKIDLTNINECTDETDPLLEEAIELIIEKNQASASLIQRTFEIDYARAGRIIDQMEKRGVISGYQGSKPRKILITKDEKEFTHNSNEISENNVEQQSEIDDYKNYIIPPIELISNNNILRDIIETEDFRNSDTKLISVLGKNETKENVIIDIEDSGHLLLIGNEHKSKKLYINALIASIMYKSKPNEVKMIMINPNLEEANIYNEIPHLLIPTITDDRRAAGGLAWAVQEMKNRYLLFENENCIDIDSYNERVEENFPYILIVIDEIQDLIVNAKIDIEDAIYQLVEKGIKAGIYLVIATDETNSKTMNDKVNYEDFSKVIFKSLENENIQISYLKGQENIELQGATMLDEELNKVIQYTKNETLEGEIKI